MRAMRALLLFWVASLPSLAAAADRAWEFQGDFVSLKPDNAAVAIFQLPDKTRIEVPLAALAEVDRAAIREAMESERPAPATEALTTRGPLGKSVTLVVPGTIKAVETDAIWCRDAADAVLVYELYLAGDALSAAERSAAELRLADWRKLAAEKRVRQGVEWVVPEARAETRRKTDEMLQHALQLLKLGNTKLAETEFEKASRLNPEDGRAEFILGLAYALTGNTPNAIEHFTDALRRDPEDPWVVSNLVVCEFMSGRYGGLASRFREILDIMPDAQLVADNLGVAIVTGAAAKPKMPDRIVGDLNDLYRQVVQMLKLKVVENVGGRKLAYVTPYGKACTPGPATTLPALLQPPKEWIAGSRSASGAVIAPGHVLTSRRVLGDLGDVWVEDPAIPGRRLPASEVASLEDPPVTLLKCDELVTDPLPVAAAMPAAGADVFAAIRVGGPLSGVKAEVLPGKVVSLARPDIGGRFIHSAAVSRGPGGGPIVDASGRLVGLVAHTPRADASGNMRGLGIPVERIWPLLKEQLQDLQAAEASASTSSREVIAGQVPAATVRVVSVEKRVKPRAE